MFRFLSALVFLAIPMLSSATHLRGGQIRVHSKIGLTMTIELTVFLNTGSEITFGEGILDFGDGSNHPTPTIAPIVIDAANRLGVVRFVMEHTYAEPGNYKISYLEPNLTGGLINVFNSVENRFYIEAVICLTGTGNYFSPMFLTNPIFVYSVNNSFAFSTAVVDDKSNNEFFYKYALVTQPHPIEKYMLPETMKINPYNGMVTWDALYKGFAQIGEYWIVVRVEKYNKQNEFLGYVLRGVSITGDDFPSSLDITSSINDVNNRTTVTVGQEKDVKIALVDYDGDDVDFDIFSSDKIGNNFSVSEYDSSNHVHKIVKIKLKTTSDIVSDLPYSITIRARSGKAQRDFTFLYMTRDIELPNLPTVITAVSEEQRVNIYPNPFRSHLMIEGSDLFEATFTNSVGQVVMKTSLQSNQPVNTNDLPSGFYLLQIIDNQGSKKTLRVLRN